MKKRLSIQGTIAITLTAITFQMTVFTPCKAYGQEQEAKVTVKGAKANMSSDDELAFLLVKLEKRTRAVIGGHYIRKQEGGEKETHEYKNYLIENGILPAAVAGPIFAETVPEATQNRAWVKMVVPSPRNPKNTGDNTALSMVKELQNGNPFVWKTTNDAVYYGEPITVKTVCLPCHGDPAGAPDPYFPEYTKDGWQVNSVIGGVISRVSKE